MVFNLRQHHGYGILEGLNPLYSAILKKELIMKKIILFLSLALLPLTIFAKPLSEKEKAVDAFLQYQIVGSDKDLMRQIQKLKDSGFTEQGITDGVVLNGGCGFAGCSYNFFVSTTFNSFGANTQTASVAAVVRASTLFEKGEVKKVLTEKELDILLEY